MKKIINRLFEKINISNSIHIIVLVVIVFMGIGYSTSFVTTDLKLQALVKIKSHNGIFITTVDYVDNKNADLTNSNIISYDETFVKSNITLSDKDGYSEITYKITVYNSDNFSYYFDKVLYSIGESTYDNEQISFYLTDLYQGTEVKPNSYCTFNITFYYKDNILVENNSLKSYLKFNFIRKTKLKGLPNGTYSGEIWRYRFSITKIIFQNEITTYDNLVNEFDLSEENDNSIIAAIVLNEDGKTHTVYIESKDIISAPVNSQYLFSGFTKLESIENIEYLDTSYVENMRYMFSGNTNLKSLDLSSFNTSKVENMEKMFRNNSNLEYIYLEDFDVSNVKDFSNIFENCGNIKELGIENWDVSNAINISSMFAKTGIERLNLNNWNTSKVENMESLFNECEKLYELNINKIDTRNVTKIANLFNKCTNLEKLDITNFNVSKVEDFKNMFNSCSNLKNLDLSSFNPQNAKNIEGMFTSCSQLGKIDLSNFDITNVTNTLNTFYGMRATAQVIVKDEQTKEFFTSRTETTIPTSWTSNNFTIAINN